MIFIYSTFKNTEEAKKIGKLIVGNKLAVCINIWPIESVYVWENEIKDDVETAMIIKTNESKMQQIESLISENHSYDVPCIACLDVRRVNQAYKEWLVKCIE